MPGPSWERPGKEPESGPRPATPGLLRSINDRAVLDLLLEHGTLSRSDVWRLTGVSKPTASQSLARLEQSGHVLLSGVEDSGRGGRAAAVYGLNPRAGFAAAIDVTAAGVHVQIADLLGTVIGEHRHSESARPAHAIDAWNMALSASGIHASELSALVVALPGSYDPDEDLLRLAAQLPGWQEPGLLEHLEGATGVSTSIENDVNLVAIAEQRLGAVRDAGDFFLLWSDDGIGAAMTINGRLHRGSTGGAGEVAFLLVPGAPIVRNPAREDHGSFDDLAGSRAILELAAQHGIAGETAREVTATAAADGATAFLDDLAERYASALASVIAILDPPAIVLAGRTMLAGGEPLVAAIRNKIDVVALRSPRVLLGQVGDEPVIAGALLVSLETTRDQVFST